MANVWHISILKDRTETAPIRDVRYFVAADSIPAAIEVLRTNLDSLNGRVNASEASARLLTFFDAEDMKPGEFKEIAVIECP